MDGRWCAGLVSILATVAGGRVAAQNFVVDNGAVPSGPGINSSTANVDFADVDLDGDWDAALADGAEESALDQSRLWINRGGLQGGAIGTFADETAARLPSLQGSANDVEFADIDGDGDVDLHITNHSFYSNQGCRWWVNKGLLQGGTLGYFEDQTAQRWIGLGQPGSSIPPSMVLAAGGFIDYAHDSDFADLDNDGDLDLVHTSYGSPDDVGAVDTPTRIYRNDGFGYFTEFNPSGFQPALGYLAPQDPGLWCEGVYQPSTADATGSFCDIAAYDLDVEIADADGDFDLDLVLGDRKGPPRVIANRLDGSALAPALGGSLGFRDVTSLSFPPGFLAANLQAAEEFGDLDGDGDLDLVFTMGSPGSLQSDDAILPNLAFGVFASPTYLLPLSQDSEVDCLDFDNDGDLDLYFAESSWTGPDRLYRNGGGLAFAQAVLPVFQALALDAEAADVDADGDSDVLIATDNYAANPFLRNVTQTWDNHGPSIQDLEIVGDRSAAPGVIAVRALVHDNAPYYVTWYDETVAAVRLNGVELPEILARSSGGQVFRAELPGNLVGSVEYRFRSTDEHGNQGSSAPRAFVSSASGTFAVYYGVATAGAAAGTAPEIAALSVPYGGSTLYLAGHSDAPPGTAGLLVAAANKLEPALLLPGLLVANVNAPLFLQKPVATDADGNAVLAIDLPPVHPGIAFYAQFCALDPTPSGELFSVSPGLRLTTQ